MHHRTHNLARAAIIAALYVILTHMQNLLFPDSASLAIQLRLSEALGVLAFFTPSAIPGLCVGCLLFNITSGTGLPLDFLIGTLATLLAAWAMWCSRRICVFGLPLLGLSMPALFNGLLVGWELSVYVGGGFLMNAACVALGELIVLLVFGSGLYLIIRKRKLDQRFLT